MSRSLKTAVLVCCLALSGSAPVTAADVTIDMTGRITRDCLVNTGLGFRFRYSHTGQLCHTTEPTVSGDFVNLTWTPLCKSSPTDNRCPWPAGNCCVFCGFNGTTHNIEGTKGKGMAPGDYRLDASAAPSFESGSPLAMSFDLAWTPGGDINSTITCARGGEESIIQPGQSWSVTLRVPDLGQTTSLSKLDGDGQKSMQGGTLSRPLRVMVSATNNKNSATAKQGLSIQWTVKGPDGAVLYQFGSLTDNDGISAVPVTLGGALGVYAIRASCSECISNSEVSFTAAALTNEEARALKKLYGDGSGPVGGRLDNPLSVRVINTVTGDSETGVEVNFDQMPPNSCPGFSANPSFTASDANGIAKAFVSLPQQPGSCTYKASCANCLGNKEILFSVEVTPKPELNVSGDGSGGGGRGAGGGPSGAGGTRGGGGKGPLQIEYTINGHPFRLIDSSEAFVGVLTNDGVRYGARPTAGSFNWLGTATSGSGFEATAIYTKVTTPSAPARETVTRVSDGRSATANVVVQRFPIGPGEDVVRKLVARELCGGATMMQGVSNCKKAKTVHSQAYQWAFETFGSSTCHNDCCDAGKHTYWHAIITGLIGHAFSVRLGDAHEVTNIADGAGHSDVAMDMFNNDLGRSLGSGYSDEGLIAIRVLQAIRSGQALVLQNPNPGDPLSLMLSSRQCAR